MKPPIFFFFIFLFMISFSSAYNCTQFAGVMQDNCVALNSVDESLIANLVYINTSYADHGFVNQYNQQIIVTNPPNNTILAHSGVITSAWISIVTISPSIFYENITYVPRIADYRSESGHNITLPGNYYNGNQVNGSTCQIIYSVDSDQFSISWQIDGINSGIGKNIEVISEEYGTVQASAIIEAVTKSDYYIWNKYCCRQYHDTCQKYCMACQYKSASYNTDRLSVQDTVNIQNYVHQPIANFTITDYYTNTYKGFLYTDNLTNVALSLNNSYFVDKQFFYYANFSHPPYNFLYIIAEQRNTQKSSNMIITNNSFYVNDASNCSIESSDFFTTQTESCTLNMANETLSEATQSATLDLGFLLRFVVLGFVLFGVYKLIKKYWGKTLIPIACLLITIPSVKADDCGITNLASCIPQKIYEFFLQLLNAPLEPLLNLIQSLLSSAPSISLFQGVWAIIVYCMSLFYGLLFVYAGFQFLFSGHDVMRREMAKEWLKNTVIMIVLIQASYYLYGLFVDLGSIMTSSVLSLVDSHFFMITADNLVNVGLEFLFILLYVMVLLVTVLFLVTRYLIVAFGVLFAPIGIFCYFIPPLRSYGKLILNILGLCIFITFLDAIIILACSMLITIPLFQNFKILVMITCFMIVDLLFIILANHIMHKTSIDKGAEKVMQAGKYIAMMI